MCLNYAMKRFLFSSGILLSAILLSSWGFFGHKTINELAVYTLPQDMIGFYKRNHQTIIQMAVNADKRRYIMKGEAARHYLDTERYGKHPFDSLPIYWKDAVAKYSADTLKAYGIVPWHILKVFYQLKEAFMLRDSSRIIRLSADLGHYVGDAHVPLHTTENYNGQLSGQEGIHGLWESRLPELYAKDYDFLTGKAVYLHDPARAAWDILKQSNVALDSVLRLEKKVSKQFKDDQKYSFEKKGKSLKKVYSPAFCKAYHQALSGMVERRMRAAIRMVGAYWYTAWVDAGQPVLSNFPPPSEFKSSKDSLEKKAPAKAKKERMAQRKEE